MKDAYVAGRYFLSIDYKLLENKHLLIDHSSIDFVNDSSYPLAIN